LADKTGGWKIFVKPKLLFGTMILGFGVAACNSAGKKAQTTNCYVPVVEPDTTEFVKCYDYVEMPDTTEKKIIKQKTKKITTTKAVEPEPEPETTCYILILDEPIREQPIDTDTTDKVYDFVPVKARFLGGEQALMKWINDNLNYPVVAVENEIQGVVFVRFIVRSDGRIDGVKIGRGIHPALDNEAIRLVKEMPRWKAGENNNGQKVSSYFTLPIKFILNN